MIRNVCVVAATWAQASPDGDREREGVHVLLRPSPSRLVLFGSTRGGVGLDQRGVEGSPPRRSFGCTAPRERRSTAEGSTGRGDFSS